MELSKREKAIYDYIVETIKSKGYAPSVRDICTAVGLKSTSTVHMYLNRLDEYGYIKKEEGKSRTLSIDEEILEEENKIPLLGVVHAGLPTLSYENFDGYVEFPYNKNNYSKEDLFALKIVGDSMVEDGIIEGDLVLVSKQTTAKNGDVVIALVDDEITVKRFYRENGHYRLQPANSAMEPIILKNVQIIGKIITVMRNYY